MTVDEYNLQRFVEAQEGIHDAAVRGIRTHDLRADWTTRIFPPMATTGTAQGDSLELHSIDEAEAYLEHVLLGGRYREAVGALAGLYDCVVEDVFGEVGAGIVQSSLTLFSLATAEPLIREMLFVWYGGRRHDPTVEALGSYF